MYSYIQIYISTHSYFQIYIYIYIYIYRDIYMYIYINIHICIHTNIYIYIYIYIHVHVYIYIYIYIYTYTHEEHTSYQNFYARAFKTVVDSWKVSMLLFFILWDDRHYFYDFRFKSTATAAIGIHLTKAWLSQLVNFKNAIWHFRRTIGDKILF